MRFRVLGGLLFLLGAALVGAACVGDDPAVGGGQTQDGGTLADGAPIDGSGSEDGSGPPPCGTPNAACCAGNACNGGSQCNGTICVCPGDLTACGSTCVDTKTSVAHCGRCDHDCFGGSCGASKCAAYTVTPSQTNVRHMFTNGGRIYWSRGTSASTTGAFLSAKLDGTDLVSIHDAGMNPCAGGTVALGKAYFACFNGTTHDIRQCTLPCAAGSSTIFKAGVASLSNVVADPATGTVYYAVPTPYNQAPNGLVLDTAGNRVGAIGQANPNDLTIANGFIYWLNSGTYAADTAQKNGGVKRASLAAIGTENVVVSSGANYFDNSTLAVDTNNVYYAGRELSPNETDVVFGNVTAAGAAPTVFANNVGAYVASDGTNVFFDEPGTNSVRYCSRAGGCGGGKTLLSASEASVSALVVDADSVLWAKFGGEIRRIAKP